MLSLCAGRGRRRGGDRPVRAGNQRVRGVRHRAASRAGCRRSRPTARRCAARPTRTGWSRTCWPPPSAPTRPAAVPGLV